MTDTNGNRYIILCRECGATVVDRELHDAWHDRREESAA